jgi:hypothetical protein
MSKPDAFEILLLAAVLVVIAVFGFLIANAEPSPCVDGKRKTVMIIGKVIIPTTVNCGSDTSP